MARMTLDDLVRMDSAVIPGTWAAQVMGMDSTRLLGYARDRPELIAFPSIPVKVTMDEWIEISKYYSTQGSSTFINGVLDKIVASLTEEGLIQKSGRGLI